MENPTLRIGIVHLGLRAGVLSWETIWEPAHDRPQPDPRVMDNTREPGQGAADTRKRGRADQSCQNGPPSGGWVAIVHRAI